MCLRREGEREARRRAQTEEEEGKRGRGKKRERGSQKRVLRALNAPIGEQGTLPYRAGKARSDRVSKIENEVGGDGRKGSRASAARQEEEGGDEAQGI